MILPRPQPVLCTALLCHHRWHAIVPIEEYDGQIGHHIVPAIGGAGEIVKAWPGAMVFLEQDWYPGEEASLQAAELGQARKEGIVVVDIVPRRHPMSALV